MVAAAYWFSRGRHLFSAGLLTFQTFEHRRSRAAAYAARSGAHPHRHVALFVPCKGSDADLEANLRPLFEQDHASYELVFVVESDDDPACPPIRPVDALSIPPSAAAGHGRPGDHSGQKVHNLLAATEDLPPERRILAFADADIRPPRDWLRL